MEDYILDKELDNFKSKYSLAIPSSILLEALTHPSYHNKDEEVRSYEQLETLGDTVLDLIVTKQLIETDPDIGPGNITHFRSILVNNHALAKLGKELQIDELIRSDDGYEIGNRDIANIVEALFGSIFFNSGLDAAEAFYNQVKGKLRDISDYGREGQLGFYNPVGRLQEFCQSKQLSLPSYSIIGQIGPDHDPIFQIDAQITVDDEVIVKRGEGTSKKEAKHTAASKLLNELQELGAMSEN